MIILSSTSGGLILRLWGKCTFGKMIQFFIILLCCLTLLRHQHFLKHQITVFDHQIMMLDSSTETALFLWNTTNDTPSITTTKDDNDHLPPHQLTNNNASNNTTMATPSTKMKLRLDWTNVEPQSKMAKHLFDLQHNCNLTVRTAKWRLGAQGMGMFCDTLLVFRKEFT